MQIIITLIYSIEEMNGGLIVVTTATMKPYRYYEMDTGVKDLTRDTCMW